MGETLSERRMAENEVMFREFNEKVQHDFEELKKIAVEHDQTHFVEENDIPLHFYCECSDKDCQQRIVIKPSRYTDIHTKRDRFIILPNHDVPNIEQVVSKEPSYWIVEKYLPPPATAKTFKPTPVDNT